MKKGSIILLLFLLHFLAQAQTSRHLQIVNLSDSANWAYLGYSLPEIAVEAIKKGELQPYILEKGEAELQPLTLEEFEENLILREMNADLVDPLTGENITIFPSQLHFLLMDVTKENGKVIKINYISFGGNFGDSELPQYKFTVSFPDLAKILNRQQVLWVKNSFPFIWKNQVLNTRGEHVTYILQNTKPELQEVSYVRLTQDKKRRYEQVQYFNEHHELVSSDAYQQLLQASENTGQAMLMSRALQEGNYQVMEDELIETLVPEAPAVELPKKPVKSLMVFHRETIPLEHPQNQHLYQENQELSSLLLEAAEKNELPIYRTDSLSGVMSKAELLERLSIQQADFLLGEEQENVVQAVYRGRDVTIVEMVWKKYFNQKGEITRQVPYAVGLVIPSRLSPIGLEERVGYFAFKDVYGYLKNIPSARYTSPKKGHLLNDLLNQNYYAYFYGTSPIVAEKPEKLKFPKVK